MNAFGKFVLEHADDDSVRLILSKGKWPDVDVDAAAVAIECRKKLRTKLPSWFAEPEIIYPDRIACEQCSSEDTAGVKASIAYGICGDGCRIADLTGGLGVDSLAFSKIASTILYNEMSVTRADLARHNFSLLGAHNISVITHETGNQDEELWQKVEAFRPDMVFLDPARRSASGSKVFRLEDCSPDVTTILGRLFECAPNLMLKLSPMADISLLVNQLMLASGGENHVRKVYVLSSGGECKELLFLLTAESSSDEFELIVRESDVEMSFRPSDEKTAVAAFLNEESLFAGPYLYEPGKALSKSGMFKSVAVKYGLVKAAVSTQLYFASDSLTQYPELQTFGKWFKILEILPFDNANMKFLSKRYPKCEISARNLPISSDDLRRKMKVASGGDVHIFATHIDFAGGNGGNFIFVGQRQK